MRLGRKSRGIITVFVTLIMVPVVMFTGIFVDAARIKLYSSQAAMAADSYGEVVLSEYDNLLKDLYGLFSVTQNATGLQAIKDLAEYTGYSFNPASPGKELEGFMPYKNASVEVKYEKVAGADLVNENVLMTQIADFMRYRSIACLMQNEGILDALDDIENASADMKVVKQRTEITDESQEILEKIGQYYDVLTCIYEYPAYYDERASRFEAYAGELRDIYTNKVFIEGNLTYGDYVYYVKNKSTVEDAIKQVEKAKKDDKVTVTETQKELAEAYANFDAKVFQEKLQARFDKYNLSKDDTSYKIVFGQVEEKLKSLESLAKEIDTGITTLNDQIIEMKKSMEGCSKEMREGIEKEIKDLENITKLEGEFSKLVNELKLQGVVANDKTNLSSWESNVTALWYVEQDLLAGNNGLEDWNTTIWFEWYDFYTRNSESKFFYDELKKACNAVDGNVTADPKAGEKKIEQAKTAENEAKKSITGEESTEARSISDDLAKELLASNSLPVPDLYDCITAELSVSGLSGAMSGLLLTLYDYNMFSSRVSGIQKKEENKTLQTGSSTQGTPSGTTTGTATGTGGQTQEKEEEYYDQSLTKVKMSKDVNYLYQAELEYLLAGHNSSKDNLAHTRNLICGVRLAMNFTSTYIIGDINTTISTIATEAAAAVSATGVGAFVAPLVHVAVSGALRLAVATIETAADWKDLLDRKDVLFIKMKLGDLTAIGSVMSLLGKNNQGGEKSPATALKLSYEDYVFILLLKDAVMNSEQLLHRTSNLITLNVNQCQNKEDKLSSLNFQMKNTITAVKSTCTVDLEFVIVPESFMNLFISGTEAEGIIQKLEDQSYGYSVIRGY